MVGVFVIGLELDNETADCITGHSNAVIVTGPVDASQEPRWLNRLAREQSEIGLGAAGCLLAHEAVWEMIGELGPSEDERFLVLEDDAVITPYGLRWLQRTLKKKMPPTNLWHLGATRGVMKIPQAFTSGLPPLLTPGFAWRTHSYLISSKMALHLLNQKFDFSRPVDGHLRKLFRSPVDFIGCRVGTFHQALFSQSDRTSLVRQRGR